MQIGIISMQRVYNYGSFLQAYALKHILEEMGHTTAFIDIEQTKNEKSIFPQNKLYKLFKKMRKIKYFDQYFFKRIKLSKKNNEMNCMFQAVQKKYFGIDSAHKNFSAQGFNAVVIGSDEIFNCEPHSPWGVTAQRFGEIPDVGITFSYAASCGYTSIDDMTAKDEVIIRSALQKMKKISVRDQNTADFVKYLLNLDPEVNLDPVFIYGFEKELDEAQRLGVPSYPYMIVYAYHNRIEDLKEIKAIKNYAKKNSLRTIAIGGSLPWCDEFVVLSPFQVLEYFKKAQCIVTDTFHGSVMAIKFNKPFAVLVRNNNRNKLDDLLKRLNATEHKVEDTDDLSKILDKICSYEEANKIIVKEKKRAVRYIQSALK